MRTAVFYSGDLRDLEAKIEDRFSELRRLHKVIDFTKPFDNSPIDSLEDLVEEITDKDLWELLPGVDIIDSRNGVVIEAEVLLINDKGILVVSEDRDRWHYIGFNDLSEIRERIGLIDDIETLLEL